MPLRRAAGNAGTENGKETAVFMAAELLKEDRIIRRYAVRIILRELGSSSKRYYSQAYRQCPGTFRERDRERSESSLWHDGRN